MTRYGFTIRTRSGQRIELISIMAATRADAERRLRQMYQQCEVVECRLSAVPRRVDTLEVAAVISLVSDNDRVSAPVDAATDFRRVIQLRRKVSAY
jgi:hypothetical protein